jgi:hypothetical protein
VIAALFEPSINPERMTKRTCNVIGTGVKGKGIIILLDKAIRATNTAIGTA